MNKLVISSVIQESGIKFGTSGARGLVSDFSSHVCGAFTLSFLHVMSQSYNFKKVAIAIDNRPSSPKIAEECIAAAKVFGVEVDFYGVIPTPALAFKSMADKIPAIMVTGSHIPFDRNGFKFYRPDGEISKDDESAMLLVDITIPQYELEVLPNVNSSATNEYVERYTRCFSPTLLHNKRIGIYEHSSSGRDIYSVIFKRLGATVISLGRSDEFVPIDTEAVSQSDIDKAKYWQQEYKLDAIFSTDGDGDRPLLADENGNYFRGDILCLLAARSLEIEVLAVPVSCSSSIEKCDSFKNVIRTKIGSPYVISEFQKLRKEYKRIAGFEANGGFLLGSDIELNHAPLSALPTRDALLPVLAVLSDAKDKRLSSLICDLPRIFTASDRLQNVTKKASESVIDMGKREPEKFLSLLEMSNLRILTTDLTDGLRVTLSSNDVIHLRQSGNAPELRCYVESNSVLKANELVGHILNEVGKFIS